MAAPLWADGTNEMADDASRASYAYGLLNGSQWKAQDVGLNPDDFMKGLRDGLAGDTNTMALADANMTWRKFIQGFQQRQLAKIKVEGETFLATNKNTPGIQFIDVAQNGQTGQIQYLVLTNGTGPIPKASDRVSVIYHGTLVNGTEFDSSHGQPASFGVNQVIPGWSQALQKMPVGSTWKLFIPSELAYGSRGAGQKIPPNSALIFEVELLGIEPPAPPPAPPAAPAAPLTSDIIKVPSAEELKHGAKIEVIKPEDVQKAQAEQQQTNH